MKEGCQHKNDCSFYQKFHARISTTWIGLINIYCRGTGAKLCERKTLIERGDEKIAEDLMPTGSKVPRAFQLLP